MIQETNATSHPHQLLEKNSQSFVSIYPGDCYFARPLDATSFENGYR
jgi:hypothetical protein